MTRPTSVFTITPQRGLILGGVTFTMSVAYYVTIYLPSTVAKQRRLENQNQPAKLPVHKSMWGNIDQAIKDQRER